MGLLATARAVAEAYWRAQAGRGNAGAAFRLDAAKQELWRDQAVYGGGDHAEKLLLTALYAQLPLHAAGAGMSFPAPNANDNIRLYSYYSPCKRCVAEMGPLPNQVASAGIRGVRWRLGFTAWYLAGAAAHDQPNAYRSADEGEQYMQQLRARGWEVKQLPPPQVANAQAVAAAAAAAMDH